MTHCISSCGKQLSMNVEFTEWTLKAFQNLPIITTEWQALTAGKQSNRSKMADTESNPVLQRNLSKSNRFDLKDKGDSNTSYNLQVIIEIICVIQGTKDLPN